MARYQSREYTNRYGDLVVSVKSVRGVYYAKVVRPMDGYEVTIEAPPSHNALEAARYALWLLAEDRTPRFFPSDDNPALKRARAELSYDAREALMEISEQEEQSEEIEE